MAHATAAKAGVDALTRTLALEWAPDRITVNAVAPGPIPTEGVKKAFTPPAGGGVPDLFKMDAYAKRYFPLGRWGTPEDVGQMVTFLASPAGEWITGAIFMKTVPAMTIMSASRGVPRMTSEPKRAMSYRLVRLVAIST